MQNLIYQYIINFLVLYLTNSITFIAYEIHECHLRKTQNNTLKRDVLTMTFT